MPNGRHRKQLIVPGAVAQDLAKRLQVAALVAMACAACLAGCAGSSANVASGSGGAGDSAGPGYGADGSVGSVAPTNGFVPLAATRSSAASQSADALTSVARPGA